MNLTLTTREAYLLLLLVDKYVETHPSDELMAGIKLRLEG